VDSKKLFCARCVKMRRCSQFWTGQWQCENCSFFIGSATVQEIYGSIGEYRAARRSTWMFILQPILILLGLLVALTLILSLISG
jgi:hypothetical protein